MLTMRWTGPGLCPECNITGGMARTIDVIQKHGFGLRLRQFRRGQKMTQRELAEHCGVSSGYIGLIETGERVPDGKLLQLLASALKLSDAQRAELSGSLANTNATGDHSFAAV